MNDPQPASWIKLMISKHLVEFVCRIVLTGNFYFWCNYYVEYMLGSRFSNIVNLLLCYCILENIVTVCVVMLRVRHSWGRMYIGYARLCICVSVCLSFSAFSALTLLVGCQEEHPARRNLEWWGAGVVIFWSEVHIACMWFSWCQCYSIMSASAKSRMVYPSGTDLGSPGQMIVKRL